MKSSEQLPYVYDPTAKRKEIKWLFRAACDRTARRSAAPSKQFSIRREKWMWAVEASDRDLMGYDAAIPLARKPGVEVEGGRLNLEGGLAQFGQIEIDGMVRGRADRGRHACKHGQCGAMDMARCDQLNTGMTAHGRGQIGRIEEVLAVHVPDPRLERWMMQKQQRRTIGRRSQRLVKPLQRGPVELAMWLAVYAGIQQQQIEPGDLDLLVERPGCDSIGRGR